MRRVVAEHDVDVSQVKGTGKGGRLTKENVMSALDKKPSEGDGGRTEKRVPMTRMRARIAERLLEVKQSTAMLTTFNEINLSGSHRITQPLQKKNSEKAHNARLGFMSFFVKAAVESLKNSPIVNASIDGNDIVYHGYYDIGVAVSTDRGQSPRLCVMRNSNEYGRN